MNQIAANGYGHGQVLTQEQQLALMQAQLERDLLTLVEKNKASFQALQKQGIGFDPMQLLSARLDSLIDSLAGAFGPQGKVWAVQCRLEWERAVETQLESANEQGTKAQLSLGGQFTPEMIRQLAKETGTFGPVQPMG